jgi:uncharacterized protein YxeA
MAKNIAVILIAIIVLAVAGFTGYYWFKQNGYFPQTQTQTQTPVPEPKEKVSVSETAKSLEETKTYYLSLMKEPDYKFMANSGAPDTNVLKILVFSTKTGTTVVRMEKIDTGTKVTVTDNNLLK